LQNFFKNFQNLCKLHKNFCFFIYFDEKFAQIALHFSKKIADFVRSSACRRATSSRCIAARVTRDALGLRI